MKKRSKISRPKRVQITYTDRFTGDLLGSSDMPWDQRLAVKKHYSDQVKRLIKFFTKRSKPDVTVNFVWL